MPLVVAGCFSNTAVDDTATVPPGDDASEDAGPEPDATVVEAAAPEAATPETSVPDAAPTTVTVVVVNDHGPEQGATVVFQDATGNVVTTAITDASGKATQLVAAGSQVTAVLGTPQNIELVTIEGVMPGDVLTAHDATDTTFASGQVSIDAVPDAGTPPGTTNYQINIGRCSDNVSALPVQTSLSPDCERNGTFPVLVQAMDDDDIGTLGYTYQTGNTFPLDGGVAHVSLSGAWSTSLPSQSISVTNFPDPNLTGFLGYSEIANGVASGTPTYVNSDEEGGASATFPVHPGYATSVQNEANVSGLRGGAIAVSAIAARTAPSPDGGAASFDLSTLLPLLDAVTIDSSQPGQPTVSWVTEAGSLAAANGTVVELAWSGTNDGGDVQGTWTIIAPPTATSVHAPALPASLAAWAPSADAAFTFPANVIVVQGSFLPDYAQLRALFSTLPPTSSLLYENFNVGGVVPPLPVDGTLRLTAYTTNAD